MKKPVMITIILAIIFVMVGFVWYLFATGLRIDGIILDSVEKKPIPQASIQINPISSTKTNKSPLISNKEGKFTLHVPIYPSQKLIIEKNGFKSLSKNIEFKGWQGIRNYEIYLEPLTFENLLNTARKDLLGYESFTFRYIWKNRIGENDQTIEYMIYEMNKDKILHFKYLQDDRFGNMKSEREIIKNKEEIYYRNNFNPAWMKIHEKDISVSKLQEPYDILQILEDDTEPDSFIYDGTDTLYLDALGKVLLKEELPINSKEPSGKEISYRTIAVNIYTAKWNRNDGLREIKFYIDNTNYRLYKCLLTDESPEKLRTEELGKMIKQNLTFTISNINETVEIKIPEI